MNRNLDRNQQNTNINEELKDHLFSRIEIEWGKNRNDNIVDQLAAEHPELAIDLYEFFALLIGLELDDKEGNGTEEDDGDQVADEKMKNWLETEGFEIAMTAAAAECKTTATTTPPIPEPPDPSQPAAPTLNVHKSNKIATEDTFFDSKKIDSNRLENVIPYDTFVRKMHKKHGWGLKDTSAAIDAPGEFILFAQGNQDERYDPVRDAITDLYIEKIGGDRREIRESFNQPLGMVASTGTTTMNQNSYEEMVAKAKLTKSKKKFWLDLVSAEKEKN